MIIRKKAWRLTMLSLAAALMALTACQTSNKYVGTGPLWVSPGVANFFEEYKGKFNPEYFAISTDGRCAYRMYYQGASYAAVTPYRTVQGCESYCKRSCKILARRKEVVWDGPVQGLK